MQRYKVVMCPKCRVIQTTESGSRLLCTACGKSTQFKSTKTGHEMLKVYDSFANPRQAMMLCSKLKEDKSKS